MSHDHHEALPGYHPDQLLVDGCAECEQRARSLDHGISSLDPTRFRHACIRARRWVRHGLPNLSEAELPMLHVLTAVESQLRYCWGGPVLTGLDETALG